jgi:hypothetical protein
MAFVWGMDGLIRMSLALALAEEQLQPRVLVLVRPT